MKFIPINPFVKTTYTGVCALVFTISMLFGGSVLAQTVIIIDVEIPLVGGYNLSTHVLGVRSPIHISSDSIHIPGNYFSIYPNPVNSHLKIRPLSSSLPTRISLQNSDGEMIFESEYRKGAAPLEVRDVLPGFYSLKIESAHGFEYHLVQII